MKTATIQEAMTNPAKMAIYLSETKTAEQSYVEITQAVKNADMIDIPHHAIGNDLTGKSIVVIDPLNPLMAKLADIYNENDLEALNMIKHIVTNSIIIDNSKNLDAGFDPSVLVHPAVLN